MLHLDTAVLPEGERLARFAACTPAYRIDALGDPLAFAADCRAARIGEVNVMHTRISPVRYWRTPEQIEADGEDRLMMFHIVAGHSLGLLGGKPVEARPGEALLWDLTRPLDVRSPDGVECEAISLPRFMIEEVLPGAALGGVIAPSPALSLALDHARYLLEHADALPPMTLAFQGRALRDMLMTAFYPAAQSRDRDDHGVPLLRRVTERIDRDPGAAWDLPRLAILLREPIATLAGQLDRVGGFDVLLERRRLLAAYRWLGDPMETAPISVIAARCGFTNLPRFSRRFHAAFHITARDLRVHHRADLPAWTGAHHLDKTYAAIITS